MRFQSVLSVLLVVVSIAAVSCGDKWWKKKDKDKINHGSIYYPTPVPISDSCEQESYRWSSYYPSYASSQLEYTCYSDEDASWFASCTGEDCKKISVFSHYMIEKDLGDDHFLQIEAFDNPSFYGVPIGAVEVPNFEASQGAWTKAELHLSSGTYYLRAHLTNAQDERIPYNFSGMELLADKPMGVYGALSSIQSIHVQADSDSTDPVHIYLDKLFVNEGSIPETNARVRVKMQLADGLELDAGRNVYIRLYEDEDFERTPALEIKSNSNQFRDPGNLGHAEVVSDDFSVGNYLVQVFVDLDSNGFFDEGEPTAVYSQNNVPAYVTLVEDTIRTISVTLVQ